MNYRPVSDEEALGVKCPKCGAAKTKPCVYMSVYHGPQFNPNYETKGQLAKRIRVGSPTKRVHNERRAKVDRKIELERRRAYYKSMAMPPPALFALRAFDLAEYNQTREWLRANAQILWGVRLRPHAWELYDREAGWSE